MIQCGRLIRESLMILAVSLVLHANCLSMDDALRMSVGVKIDRVNENWILLREGKTFRIRGAGGDGAMDVLAGIGGNAIRTWGLKGIEDKLDRAHKCGLSVIVGIWIGHARHGFTWDDKVAVKKQHDEATSAVQRLKRGFRFSCG